MFILLLLCASPCLCAVDSNERPRNFSIEFLYHMQAETNGHVVLSPFGLWTFVSAIAMGATGNSYEQLAKAFILPNNPKALLKGYKDLTSEVLSPSSSSGVILTSKNFVFLDHDFPMCPQFKRTLQNDFAASIKVLDFADRKSATIANTYIKKSGGRVANVLRSDDFHDSRMILNNVISFKGLWSSPFNVSDTVLEPFYNEQREVIGSVNMMYQKGQIAFSDIKELKSFVVELPYGTDGKYSMIIMRPYDNQKIGDMYKNFTSHTLKDVFEKLKKDEADFGLADIGIKIPRFHNRNNLVMNRPLLTMGVSDIFQSDRASFKQVSRASTFLAVIIHEAEIEVTESGTIASASSPPALGDRISAPSFTCDRPFIFFIMEKSTTTVIFNGVYSKPAVY